ncbi:aromatic-ring-hydroxylating dioxygenase subunit beta [Pseudonocardia sp. TRM90224]|uniref:aromatic-ring-hydroxylating dioxygenase subunit beta n=1 Tax=Pseudonocardia sp. TRM90224 TaxID=2812678 RepID=UPI001E4AE4EA|nr:aromatic-ring-hydroxylating dioxygenase subunit beta [Pseudonocardia sp. TRM90224]
MTEPIAEALAAPIPTTDPRVVRAIELIWREAELLDRKAYESWNALYTDDGFYVIPIDPEAERFDDILNMVYDDARMRRMRVARMTEGHAIAAVDAARTVRTVSRFVPESVSESMSGDEVVVRSAQILVAYKRERHDLWAADLVHRIRLSADSPAGDQIVQKIVRLVDSGSAVPAAGFLL